MPASKTAGWRTHRVTPEYRSVREEIHNDVRAEVAVSGLAGLSINLSCPGDTCTRRNHSGTAQQGFQDLARSA
jgi:hypothetical protein